MMSEWYVNGICGDCACIPVCSIYSATGGVAQCKYMIDKRAHEYMTKIKAPAAESIVMTMQCGKCGCLMAEQDNVCPGCGAIARKSD